jgi:uncharacterized membrane protein
MEKRVIGVILTLLGVIGLVMGGLQFINHSNGTYDLKVISVSLLLGLVFFFAGIGLIRSTKDVAKNNEHVS